MGEMIKPSSGLIANETLELFGFWSPFNGVSAYNGRKCTVIQAMQWEHGSSQPFSYLIRFDEDGALAEAEFNELVGAYRNAVHGYTSLETLPPESAATKFVYPDWGNVKMTAHSYKESNGDVLVTLQCGDMLIASCRFPFEEKVYYVASPLSADHPSGLVVNMLLAQKHEKEASVLTGNTRAIAPHAWLPYIVDDSDESQRMAALGFGLECIQYCTGIVVYGTHGITKGMCGEIQRAIGCGKDLIFNNIEIPLDCITGTAEWKTDKNRFYIPLLLENVGADTFGFNPSDDIFDVGLALSVARNGGNISLVGSVRDKSAAKEETAGKTICSSSITCSPGNWAECLEKVSKLCAFDTGVTLEDYYTQLVCLSGNLTKIEATHQLQLEALVFEKAEKGECWRPGGCFHNSNGFSYERCEMSESGICECYKKNQDEVIPGHSIMTRASAEQNMCNYEKMKDTLQREDGKWWTLSKS